jgi:hypothetical protein
VASKDFFAESSFPGAFEAVELGARAPIARSTSKAYGERAGSLEGGAKREFERPEKRLKSSGQSFLSE